MDVTIMKIAFVGGLYTLPFAASSIPDANLVLNLLMLVVLLFGAPRFFKSKNAEAALQEKDRTIATHIQSLEAEERRRKGTEADNNDLRTRVDELTARNAEYQKIAAGFQARYDEAQKYTAKEALGALEKMLEHQAQDSERRHQETMAALNSISALVGERRGTSRRGADPK